MSVSPSRQSSADQHPQGHHGHTAIDPVCGMTVTIEPASLVAGHDGHPYYFCGPRCREKFVADPLKYLAPQSLSTDATATPDAAQWTCPMHPEILRDRPGSCPPREASLQGVLSYKMLYYKHLQHSLLRGA